MKKIFLAVLLFANISMFAQTSHPSTDDLDKNLKSVKTELQTLQSETKKLKSETDLLKVQLKAANTAIDSLKQLTYSNSRSIRETADQLGVKISDTEAVANQRFQEVGRSVSNSTLYAIIGVLIAFLLSGLLYWLLSKRQQTDKLDMIDQLGKTKSDIEANLVKEFEKQIESMNEQLGNNTVTVSQPVEFDHSLALKVASEVNLIERNISLMNTETKGLKQLSHSVNTLKDNLIAKGYEVPVLLGKQFHQGMKVIVVNSIPDETLEKGSEIITKVLIPQVNYDGKMIQTAQIEVSVGPDDEDTN